MIRLPKRQSLVSEVAEILRKGILEQHWKNVLPGERPLAQELQVSRPTLRLALKTLEKEELICAERQGKRSIVASALKSRKPPRTVAVLLPDSIEKMEKHTLIEVETLRQSLVQSGLEFRLHVEKKAFSGRPENFLAQLIRENPSDCWIAVLSTLKMQQWFEQNKVPVVVCGSCFRGVSLNAIDLDFRAVGHHAAGMLLSKGHANVFLVLRTPLRAGDKLTEEGFCEAFPKQKKPTLVLHDGTAADLAKNMERQFRMGNRPTAYFVSGPYYLLSVVSWLMIKGQRMGSDYALISRDDDELLAHLLPSVPCYTRDNTRFSRALTRIVHRMLDDSNALPRSEKIIPAFRLGETLSAASVVQQKLAK